MVGEFPELQGVMGGYYARHDGLTEDIAFAIEDHYKPRFAGDELPRGQVGTLVALADKLETLVGMFGIGNLPTGDRDPFALRRHALGVIRMLVEKDLRLDMPAVVSQAAQVFGALLPDAARSNEQLRRDLESLRSRDADAASARYSMSATIRPVSRTRVRSTWKRRRPRTRSDNKPSGVLPKSSITASVPKATGVAGVPASLPSRIRQMPKPDPLRPHSPTMSR